jgi:phosphatidate cytidylyltransferase
MADGDSDPVPLAVKTSDLKVRTLSAVVMLIVLALAAGLGEIWFNSLIAIVAILGFGEFVRLVTKIWETLLSRIIALSVGALYMGLAAYALLALGRYGVFVVIVLVACADIFAYFFGRTLGGPKIAPSISPSKTWAGLIGAIVGGALVGGLQTYVYWHPGGCAGDLCSSGSFDMSFYDLHPERTIFGLSLGAIFGVVAQCGDFLESWLKRKAGVKDSSSLIPGHGGVLDRIDGLLAVSVASLLPISAVYMWLHDIGWIPE